MFEKVIRWFNWDSIVNWCAAAGGVVLGLAGGWDDLMKVLVVCMAVDYATGLLNAIKDKTLSSKIGFIGLLRKITIFGVVVIAAQVDAALGMDAVCRTAAITFYTANECVSVLENAASVGLPVPQKLVDTLGQLKGSGEKEQSE
jgi:toxin secretion/phage lysis holin